MTQRERIYRSYLLRIWVEMINGEHTWRLSIEDSNTFERRGFISLKELCEYLEVQMGRNMVGMQSDQEKRGGDRHDEDRW